MRTRTPVRLLAVLLTLVGLVLAQPALGGPRAGTPRPLTFSMLVLVPGGGGWPIFHGGTMQFTPAGPTFTYRLEAHGLSRHEGYTLVYLHRSGGGALCLGTGTTNAGGALRLQGAPDLDGDLPAPGDRGDRTGARIALVLAGDVDCHGEHMVRWAPASYLFGRRLITYHDTDHTTDYSGTYCMVTQSPGQVASFEAQITQAGTVVTATVEGTVASGTLSGQTATLTGATPDGPVTLVVAFSDDGTTFSGTLTLGSGVATVSGTRGACSDYEFPAGDPVCTLPVADPGLVVGGQQYNSVSGGVTHTGLDFEFATPLPAIVAPCDGVIVQINRHAISEGNVIFDVVIKYNSDWTTFVAFEPYSPDPGIATHQEEQIAVTLNQVVRRGDLLGHLVVPATEFPHVHWGVNRSDALRTPVCPRDDLLPEAKSALDALYGGLGLAPACLP